MTWANDMFLLSYTQRTIGQPQILILCSSDRLWPKCDSDNVTSNKTYASLVVAVWHLYLSECNHMLMTRDNGVLIQSSSSLHAGTQVGERKMKNRGM